MKLRRKRAASVAETRGLPEGYEPPSGSLTPQQTDPVGALTHRVDELEQLVAELVKATHDHCLGCGEMTPEYGMTMCGRARCRQGVA